MVKKGFAPIFILLTVFIIGAGGLFVYQKVNKPTEVTVTPTITVPLPTEKDMIRTFFNLINEKKIPEAISMMSKANIEDDSTKQAWGVQFNAIKSIAVLKIDQSMPEKWTNSSQSYKVLLDVDLTPEAINAPIPNYGWSKGQNTRWVILEKEERVWKIAAIATGP